MFKKLNDLFHIPNWLFVVLLLVIIFRIPNFFEPYSYGDETIYLTLGQGIRQGVTLYKDLHDNKPPLLYITAAVAGNLFWFKAILLFMNIFGITLFYKFSEKLYPKIRSFPIVSTIIFSILITIPFFEGNIANAENFMILTTIAAFYILLNKKNSYQNIFISGILLSLSTLYKVPAIFDVPAIIFYWLLFIKFTKKDLSDIAKNTAVLFLGIAAPIVLTFIYYALQGAFGEYLIAAYLQNFGYLSSWRPDDKTDPFLTRNAPLLIRAGVIFTINIYLFTLRKKIDKKFLFLVSWLTFSLFAVTLSERPYPHYLLQTSAVFSTLIALLLTSQSMLQVYSILPLTLLFFTPFYYKFWNYRSANYYGNFISYITNLSPYDKYMESFGGRVKTNYEIAGVINKLTISNDKIFVWEDSAQIYALTKRLPPSKYLAGYHIKDFSSTGELLQLMDRERPKVIVLLKDSDYLPSLNEFVRNYYVLYKDTERYQIWKLGGEYSKHILY